LPRVKRKSPGAAQGIAIGADAVSFASVLALRTGGTEGRSQAGAGMPAGVSGATHVVPDAVRRTSG